MNTMCIPGVLDVSHVSRVHVSHLTSPCTVSRTDNVKFRRGQRSFLCLYLFAMAALRGSVLIAGANGAIGSSLARMVAARGARPILAGRDAAALKALSAELNGAEARIVDFSQVDTVAAGLKDLPDDLTGLDDIKEKVTQENKMTKTTKFLWQEVN